MPLMHMWTTPDHHDTFLRVQYGSQTRYCSISHASRRPLSFFLSRSSRAMDNPGGGTVGRQGSATHRPDDRERLALGLLAQSDAESSFLVKVGRCIENYSVCPPTAQVTFKVTRAAGRNWA